MTKYNTIPNDDEALLAPKKQKSFKGLVAGAALASFVLGIVAASALSTSPMEAVTRDAVEKRAAVLVDVVHVAAFIEPRLHASPFVVVKCVLCRVAYLYGKDHFTEELGCLPLTA